VQATKTGFALRPASSDVLTELEAQTSAIIDFFGTDSCVEKASNWVTYRISSVPRNITTLHIDAVAHRGTVTPELMHLAIAKASGITPTAVFQSIASVAAPLDYTSNWIAKFPSESIL
jgi:hypothetical protein